MSDSPRIADVKIRRDGRVVLRRNLAHTSELGSWAATLGNEAILGTVRPGRDATWEWSRGDGRWRAGYRLQTEAVTALLERVSEEGAGR